MSTIASLLGMIGQEQPRPWDIATRSQTQADTGLIELARLKQSQASEEEVMAFYRQHPELLVGGGSVLGSLGTAPGGPPPGAGPMTQQTFGGGQPPGAPQIVPGGQDLSRYAHVSPQGGGPIPPDVMGQVTPTVTPPQGQPGVPTLATLGGQPQGPQMQGPQNPLLEMARRDPRAAMMLQGQMQASQDRQWKMQEQQLKMREATADAFASKLQGVNSQESYETAVQDLMQWAPQQASRLPRVWSKEAMQPIIDSALSAKDKATLGIQTTAAQAELTRARMAGRVATTDQYLKALGIAPGQEQPEDMQKALAWQQRDEVARQAAHGTGQIVMTPAGAVRVGKDNQVEVIKGPDGQPIYDKPTAAAEAAASYGDRAKRAHDNAVALENKGITPSLWAKVGNALPLGLGNYLVGEDQRDYQRAVNQFGGALLRKESGAVISQTEYDMIDRTFFPQPNDSKKMIDDKRREREAIIKNLQEEGKGAGRTGGQAQPTSQGATGTGGQGGNTFNDADIAATMANPRNKGKTRQQIIDGLLAKDMTYQQGR